MKRRSKLALADGSRPFDVVPVCGGWDVMGCVALPFQGPRLFIDNPQRCPFQLTGAQASVCIYVWQ